MTKFRCSRPEEFCKKGAVRNFAKFTGKHLCQSLFFNKVAGLYFTQYIAPNDWAIKANSGLQKSGKDERS